MNFYNVHYAYTHIVGTSGGNTDDIKESLEIMDKGLDPAGLVTHIGGLNAVPVPRWIFQIFLGVKS